MVIKKKTIEKSSKKKLEDDAKKKRDKTKYTLLLIVLVLILIAVDYPIIDKFLKENFVNYELGIVERVVDGDTIIVNESSVRLLGINAPEEGDLYYGESKAYLENLSLHKLVKMEKGKQDVDMYDRKLRYISYDGQDINIKLVEKGLANYYFPQGKDQRYNDFKQAWETCIDKKENLCEFSTERCAPCIKIKELDVKSQRLVLRNTCSYYCRITGWTIKDEGRKVFTFPNFILEREVSINVGEGTNTKDMLFWQGEDYVWTDTGDSLFLRDRKGKLILWHSY